MTWTNDELKVAIGGLSPMPPDDNAIANVLNVQTVARTGQPFPWGKVKGVARRSATGDWARIVARARQMPVLPPATALDVAILAAINATEGVDSDIIDPAHAEAWGAFQGGVAALRASGDLSVATASAIAALASQTGLLWEPPVTAADVQTAKSI